MRQTARLLVGISMAIAAGLAGPRMAAADPASQPATRLFFGPTARALPAGGGYVAAYQFLLPQSQVGVTDRFSLGGGTPLLLPSDAPHPIWLTPKLQLVNRGHLQMAVGAVHVLNSGDPAVGMAYAVVTKGSDERSVTAGIGWGYADGGHSVVAMVGGQHRVRNGVELLSENYVFANALLAINGVRLTGSRVTLDLGVAMAIGAGLTASSPIVNVGWKF
jgi:hypothetical protein